MGKQSTPATIRALENGSPLVWRDACELYADTPKRLLFDALWDLLATTPDEDGKKRNAYDIAVEMSRRVRQR